MKRATLPRGVAYLLFTCSILLPVACASSSLGTSYDVLPRIPAAGSIRVVEVVRHGALLPQPHRWHEARRLMSLDLADGSIRDRGKLTNGEWAGLQQKEWQDATIRPEWHGGNEWQLELETAYGRWEALRPPGVRFRGDCRVWTTTETTAGRTLFVGGQSDPAARGIEFWRTKPGSGQWTRMESHLPLGADERVLGAAAVSEDRVYVAIQAMTTSQARTFAGDFASGQWRLAGHGHLAPLAGSDYLLDIIVRKAAETFHLRRARGDTEETAELPRPAESYARLRVLPEHGRFLIELHRLDTSFPHAVVLASFERVLSVIGNAGELEAGTALVWTARRRE